MADTGISDDVLAAIIRDAAANYGTRSDDQSDLDRRRGAQVSMRMDLMKDPVLFRTGERDAIGGSAEESQGFHDAKAAEQSDQSRAISALAAEADRNAAFDRQENASVNDGVVQPDGSVVFNDMAARGADSDNGRRLQAQLAEDIKRRELRMGRRTR